MIDSIKTIQTTIEILNSYNKLYKEISKGRFDNYSDYTKGNFADEDKLIKPKLWTDFLQTVLGFPKDEYITEQEGKIGTPDFQPRDQKIHSFFFEIKGTDTDNLSTHFPKIDQYLKPPLKWGIITNMRDLDVYTQGAPFPVPDYSFSFAQLYRDYKTNKDKILEFPNTKRFLEFVNRFSYKKVSAQDKIEYLKKAPQWTQLEVLDPDELIITIRKVVGWLIDDARSQKNFISEYHKFDTKTKDAIALEIENITCELDKKRTPQEKRLEEYLKSKDNTLEYRAFEIYLSRVAYFTMTRILLARMWEDIGFIEQSLYDGGFEKWYEIRNRQIQRVLRDAFNMAGEKYSWLYNVHNNYTWFTPSEETLIDVLYELSGYNLGKLNTDVLGTVYEEYVDKIDRKNKGQYYTPREIIKLIWDRVGFNNDEAYFKYENGKRIPRLIFDLATGSGGFLVEAARRIREDSQHNDNDFDDLTERWLSIKEGLHGGEINLFAHYITEVNILIQLTPIIKKVLEHPHQYKPPQFTLSVVPCDSLGLHLPYSQLINSNQVRDQKRDITLEILDPQKRDIYQSIKKCKEYDYVCANPPYIGEKGHKELFRSTIERFPYWRQFYQGKMDYLYFFVILGLSKLRDGGRLGFITTSYWPTADGASILRKYILDNALIKEIIDFGETKIFEGAPGQHNMVFILEKCPSISKANTMVETPIQENIEKKKKHQIKIVKVKDVPKFKGIKPLKGLIDHIEKYIDKKEYSDDYIDVFYSAVKQNDLTEGVWNIMVQSEIETILEKIKKKSELLINKCNINQGIVSGADKVTNKNIKLLPQDLITRYNIKVGDGIFVLSPDELNSLNLTEKEKALIKPFYKNSDIDQYIINEIPEELEYIIYTTKDTDIDKYSKIKAHLEKYRPILENRLAVYKEDYLWYKLHRERETKIFEGEKIINPQRAHLNIFGYTKQPFYSSADVYYTTPKTNKVSMLFISAILNSSLLRFWLTKKCKFKGSAFELYYTPLTQIPIRSIDFNNKDEVKLHDTLVKKVDVMIETKKQLAEYNKFFTSRLTRLENPKDIPEINAYTITKSLPVSDLRVLRSHPKVEIKPTNIKEFYLHKVSEVKDAKELFSKPTEEHPYLIKLTSKDKKEVTIIAPKEIVNYLKEVLKNYKNESWDDIKEIPLAKDLKTYETRAKEILTEVKKLLIKVEFLQNEINEIVYELYGITQAERKIIEKELKK